MIIVGVNRNNDKDEAVFSIFERLHTSFGSEISSQDLLLSRTLWVVLIYWQKYPDSLRQKMCRGAWSFAIRELKLYSVTFQRCAFWDDVSWLIFFQPINIPFVFASPLWCFLILLIGYRFFLCCSIVCLPTLCVHTNEFSYFPCNNKLYVRWLFCINYLSFRLSKLRFVCKLINDFFLFSFTFHAGSGRAGNFVLLSKVVKVAVSSIEYNFWNCKS